MECRGKGSAGEYLKLAGVRNICIRDVAIMMAAPSDLFSSRGTGQLQG